MVQRCAGTTASASSQISRMLVWYFNTMMKIKLSALEFLANEYGIQNDVISVLSSHLIMVSRRRCLARLAFAFSSLSWCIAATAFFRVTTDSMRGFWN